MNPNEPEKPPSKEAWQKVAKVLGPSIQALETDPRPYHQSVAQIIKKILREETS